VNLPTVAPIQASPLAPIAPTVALPAPAATAGVPSFASLLTGGIDAVNARALDADKAVHDFILGEQVPVHQVTYALEQARLSMELMMQVRSRLLEGYQQLMNMQL
jgi:flagellar hook-basal body complex protein FliE